MQKDIRLLIIDAQNDFCDLPPDACPPGAQPALPVHGAYADMLRLAKLIDHSGNGLNQIAVSLDSHHEIDIAHPTFWSKADGTALSPFTSITAAQVRAGEFVPKKPATLPQVLAYLDALEATKRYTLMVWPVHCVKDSWGHQLNETVEAACERWETRCSKKIYTVFKGMNPWTEHYSVLLAEVPDSNDPTTLLNHDLLDWVAQADLLLVAGEAGSHCVRATVEHLLDFLPNDWPQKLMLLTDLISPIEAFITPYQKFLEAICLKGARLSSSIEILPFLQKNEQV